MSEIGIVQAVQQVFLASTWGEWSAIMLARLWIFLFVPVLAWMWMRDPPASHMREHGGRGSRDKHAVKEAVWALLASVLAGEVISLFVMRLRPYLTEPDIMALITPPLNSSFPSLHTTAAVAISTSVYLWNRNAGHVCFLITIGVVIGRVAAGMHYPTDILVGAVLGAVSALLIREGHNLIRNKSLHKLEHKGDQEAV